MQKLKIAPRGISSIPISQKQGSKIQRDLQFIKLITAIAKKQGLRVIIHGGYAVDGHLSQITRPHNDIDIQIYGQAQNGLQIITTLLTDISQDNPTYAQIKIKDKGRQKFYHSFFLEKPEFGTDIYYIQTKHNPFAKPKIVIKEDGSKTPPHPFDSRPVTLQGVTFEAQGPTTELVDRLYKRNVRGDRPKPEHDTDIHNLKLITNPKEVTRQLEKMTNQSVK